MKVKELIEKIEALPAENYKYRPYIDKKVVLALVRQLDEPQKVVVPQFVADWIETAKKAAYNIRGAIDLAPKGKVKDWLELKNVNTFAKAWVNGYEVEEEKRYRISMPRARNHKNHAQILCEKDEKIFWCGEWYPFRTKFTRKQLEEAGFGEVFNSPLFEVEEVE